VAEERSVTALPQPEHSTAGAILRWYEASQDGGHRPHLGASIIGHSCERHLWLTFRWAKAQRWDGRMLRLFDDGKRAEARFVQELRAIGCEVWEHDAAGQQFRVNAWFGHFGGSVDAVASGIPEAPKTTHIVEFKTSNEKLFKALSKDGVRKSKPQHFAQIQVYMGLLDLTRALYMVENKNDASIYTERVDYEPATFDALLAKAQRIVTATEPPPRLSDDPTYYECRWCNHFDLCHGQAVPEVNCRTCAHSTPEMLGDSAWSCARLQQDVIPIETQRAGCAQHLYIPALLSRIGAAVDATDDSVTYAAPDGSTFVNGPAPGFSSVEIAAARATVMLTDPVVQAVKAEFPSAVLVSSERIEDMPNDLDSAPVKPEKRSDREKRTRIAMTLEQVEKTS
jgi:hypothetical protein